MSKLFHFPQKTKALWGPTTAVLGGTVAFFLPQLVAYLVVSAFVAGGIAFVASDIWLMYFIQLSISIGSALIIMAYVAKSGSTFRATLGKLNLNLLKLIGLVASVFAAYILTASVITEITSQVLPEEVINQSQSLGFSTDITELQLLSVGLLLILVVPLVEELIFRGFIYKGLRTKFKFWPSAIFTAGIFALAHWQINVGIDVFIMALALAWLYERTGSLWAPILMHMLKNSIAFVLVFVVG